MTSIICPFSLTFKNVKPFQNAKLQSLSILFYGKWQTLQFWLFQINFKSMKMCPDVEMLHLIA